MNAQTPDGPPSNPFYLCPESAISIGEPITDRVGRKIQLLRLGASTIINTDDCVFSAITDQVMDGYAAEHDVPRDRAALSVVARYAKGENLWDIIDFD